MFFVFVYKLNIFLIEFKDYFTEDNSNLTRIVNDQTFVYSKGLVVFKSVVKKVSYLNKNPQII